MKPNEKEKINEQIVKLLEIYRNYQGVLNSEKTLDTTIIGSIKKATANQLRQQLMLMQSNVFEVVVFSTMSSGKSTFINALIGKELLPARNEACTSRTIGIWDNDKTTKPVLHIERGLGNCQKFLDCTSESVAAATSESTDAITDIVIETDIQGIQNGKKSLFIVDTPGINNNFDLGHAEITKEYLNKHTADLLLYIVNAEQIGTNDAATSLNILRTVYERTPQAQVLFIMNKADALDSERQPIENTIDYCRKFIESCGFVNPRILPVSSAAALLFKKVMQEEPLSRSEQSRFLGYYEDFKPGAMNLAAYGNYKYQSAKSVIRTNNGQRYHWASLVAALENTGFLEAERAIEDCLLKKNNNERGKENG